MINKQKLWFLTLFSIILVLGVYYVTMPNNILKEQTVEKKKKTTEVDNEATIEESEILAALRVEADETTTKEMTDLQEILLNEEKTSEEKNTAYEALKDLNLTKGKEESLEKLIKETFNLDSFIKIKGDQIKVVLTDSKHSVESANKLIRLIQEQYQNQMYITVSYKK